MEIGVSRRRFLGVGVGAAACHAFYAFGYSEKNTSPQLVKANRFPNGPGALEPYKFLHGGVFTHGSVLESPDPLVGYRWKDPRAADELQSYVLYPICDFSETPDSFKRQKAFTTVPIRVEGVGSIRFDFGVEGAAWFEFESPDLAGSVEMSISEYDEPAVENTGPKHRFKTLAPQRYGSTYRLELNSELYEGVRFGWIHVLTFEKPWHINVVRVVCQVKPTNYAGSFACSDPMLTRIWYTGAYSVKANLCKDYFGAILMDRGDRYSWTGDAYPAQAAALVAFGNWDFIRANLERTATVTNDIESYAMYWILSLLQYYQHTGDVQTLNLYTEHVQKMFQHARTIYDNPPISFYGWDERLGAGFEEPNRFETAAAYRMLFLQACNEFARAMESVGRNDLKEVYSEVVNSRVKELRTDGRWYEGFGVHALADAVNAGFTTEEEEAAIFAQEFEDRGNRLSYSPFNQYFLMQAMAGMNRHSEALVTARDHWGGQIEYGGTTFFEVYTPSWNQALNKNGAVPNCQAGYTSLGHAWGAGITAWLTHELLGVKPTAPGFTKVEIAPNLGGTITWVRGSVPTPHGAIAVDFDTKSGRGEITIPMGSIGRIGIPTRGRAVRALSINGKLAWDGSFRQTANIGGAIACENFLYFDDVPSGRYVLSVKYEGKVLLPPQKPLLYSMSAPMEDSRSRGSWGGVYGQDGYVLFDYDGDGQSRQALPSYVVSVRPSVRKLGVCRHAQIISSTIEDRALAPDRANGQARKVGQLFTAAPVACQQTMTVDVEITQNSHYQLALYFLDWEKQGRSQAIEIFDLKTLRRMAPVHIVRDFAQGKYLIYSCDRSLRFRVNQVRGETAVLTGLFFDPITRDRL